MVKLNVTIRGEEDLPARQVEQIREALLRHPLALVVEPAIPTDRGLDEVVDKARGEGVPVVLLNRPVAGYRGPAARRPRAEGAIGSTATQPSARQGDAAPADPNSRSPMVLIRPAPFESSASQLVASAIRNAKNARLDPHGGAILVINSLGDPFTQDRLAAVRKALQAARITRIREVSFSKDSQVGSKLLTAQLQADPKLVLVLSFDSLSSLAAREVMLKLVPDRPFILAGYAAEETYSSSTSMGDFAAVATYSPVRVVRRAIATAVALGQGRHLPSLVELPIEVDDSPPESTTARSPGIYKKKAEAAKRGL
jgi:ABC-type sugar transport system substrate-binding protein